MASTTSIMTFAPHQSSPLARAISPFKAPRTPPNTPGDTGKLWDECERIAVENARRRDELLKTLQQQDCLASAGIKSDYESREQITASPPTAVAICKTCERSITYTSGICEPCKKTIILPSFTGESTPPLSPSQRNFASVDLHQLQKRISREDNITPKTKSPKRRSFCPMPGQLLDPPIRLSSLRPPPTQDETTEATRTRKISLTDPNEPFLRLQIAPTAHHPRARSHPTTPTYPPTTPPSTSHSRTSTRPSSLSTTISPPSATVQTPSHQYTRHNSVTPSELSTLYPYTSGTASINTTRYGMQNATSAWDDWDSDEEKAGLVGLMKGIGKGKKKGRSDSKTSWESASAKLSFAREEERKKSREQKRDSGEKEGSEAGASQGRKMKPRGFVRVISCGGCRED